MTYLTIAISLLALFSSVLFNWVKATEKERREVTSFTTKAFLLLLAISITAFSIYQVYDFYVSVEPMTRKDVVFFAVNFVNAIIFYLATTYLMGYWQGFIEGKKSVKSEVTASKAT